MNAHTPGPWRVNKVLYPAGQDVSFEVLADRRLVAQTIMREVIAEDDTIAQDEANAQLIAVAPELLNLARGAWHLCESLLAVREGATDDSIRMMSAALLALIQKADQR